MWSCKAKLVITSYSIHYTKLYDIIQKSRFDPLSLKKQKLLKVDMLNPFVSPADNRIHGHHFFGMVVWNSKKVAELTIPNLVVRDHVGSLDVHAFPLLFTDKIGFFLTDLAHCHLVSGCFQVGEDYIFNNFIDI